MNLLIFLSNRCNMACDYCFLDLNKGPAVILDGESAKRAIAANPKTRVTLLGGEPFIHYALLKEIVAFIGGRVPVTVVTNGTRACPEKLRELQALGAEIVVSLDGRAADHDRHRPLVGGGGSSFEETLKALEACDKRDIRVNMVVCEDTAGSLLRNVEAIRQAGFSSLSFHANILEDWSAAGLSALRRGLKGFDTHRLRLTHLDSFAAPSADHGYDDLVLGADGKYYPCDAFFALPFSKISEWVIGDVFVGVDWKKRERMQRKAAAFIHKELGGLPHYSCPRETYFHALITGRNPAAAVRAFNRADKIMGEALSRLAAEEAAHRGDFAAAGPDFRLKERDPRQDIQYGESLMLCDDPKPYLRARKTAPRDSFLLRGVIEAFLANFRAALRLLDRAVEKRADSSWAYAWRGVAKALESRRLKSNEGLKGALADLDRAIELGGAAAFAYPWRAELRHDLDDRQGALADLEKLDGPWARVERGEILCEMGKQGEAMREFDSLAKDFPKSAWAFALRGRTLATTGREAESIKDLEKAIDMEPRSAAYRAWLSESLRKLGRYREALKQLDRAVKLDPRYVLAWVWRGRLKLLTGRFKEALADLNRAARLDPRYQLAFAWRGEALFKLGRKREAEKDFQRIAPMDPARTWNPVLREGERLTPEARQKAWRGYDLVVIGGGPAGTTLATLVKKYAPEKRVVILEKEKGPSHQVGESLLPGLVPVLKEMGVYDKVDGAGFPRKLGANYIWGMGREIWENDFNDVNVTAMIEHYGGIPDKIEYAWQVRRSVYDEILLRHAEECGVEVVRGAAARDILEEDGRIVGVTTAAHGEFRADFTADCSGQDGFLSKFRRIRQFNEVLKNVAAYAYFRGAKWKYNFTAHPDKTKIFICSVKDGWFWYIPVEKDLVSVGFVTTVEHLKKRGIQDVRALYLDELKRCDEIWPLLKDAEQVKDFEGTGKDFFTHSDWSYLNVSASGPGWLACGDAAVFVDPILSSGVTLAHLAAHRAAYTLLSWWDRPAGNVRDMLWKDYDLFCRESAAQYLVLALFWYGNDPRAQEWWGKARELQRAWLPVDLSDKGAFITVSAGLTQYYDKIFSARGLQEESLTKPEEYPFYMAAFPKDSARAPEGAPGLDEVLRLLHPFVTDYVFLPVPDKGALQPVKRVRFLKQDGRDPLLDAFNPRKIVTRYHLEVLALIDGTRTAGALLREAAARGIPPWWLDGPAMTFLKELKVQGVLESGVGAVR